MNQCIIFHCISLPFKVKLRLQWNCFVRVDLSFIIPKLLFFYDCHKFPLWGFGNPIVLPYLNFKSCYFLLVILHHVNILSFHLRAVWGQTPVPVVFWFVEIVLFSYKIELQTLDKSRYLTLVIHMHKISDYNLRLFDYNIICRRKLNTKESTWQILWLISVCLCQTCQIHTI